MVFLVIFNGERASFVLPVSDEVIAFISSLYSRVNVLTRTMRERRLRLRLGLSRGWWIRFVGRWRDLEDNC
jgi:hypothetical protein